MEVIVGGTAVLINDGQIDTNNLKLQLIEWLIYGDV